MVKAVTPKTVELGPFNLGVNTRLGDNELTTRVDGGATTSYLRSAVNVDITSPGTIKRRSGYARSLLGTDCHSLFSDNEQAYFVDGLTLYRLTGDPSALLKTAVRSGIAPSARLSFTKLNGAVIYTDGSVLRQLNGATEARLGVPMIEPPPAVAPGSVGGLTTGQYQVCFTYVANDGQQSGSTTPVQVDVAAGQGIAITGLPPVFPAGVAGLMVYMTTVNGDQLMLANVLAAPRTSLFLSVNPLLGGRCPTLLLQPMPAGTIVRKNNARLLVADGSTLHYSEPYMPALRMVNKGFISFTAPIAVIESVKTGTYVATTDETYFFSGDIASASADKVLPYGAVPGTGGVSPDAIKCWWMSTRGLVQAGEGGAVKNVQEAAIAMNRAAAGASLYREKDGMKQIVSSLFGTDKTGASAYSFMQAEIVRQGVTK